MPVQTRSMIKNKNSQLIDEYSNSVSSLENFTKMYPVVMLLPGDVVHYYIKLNGRECQKFIKDLDGCFVASNELFDKLFYETNLSTNVRAMFLIKCVMMMFKCYECSIAVYYEPSHLRLFITEQIIKATNVKIMRANSFKRFLNSIQLDETNEELKRQVFELFDKFYEYFKSIEERTGNNVYGTYEDPTLRLEMLM